MRRTVPAGLIDSAFASLATFAVGLYATITWRNDPATLGIYALFMAAFLMAMSLPHQGMFVPAEKVALAAPGQWRIRIVHRTILLGLAPVAASVVVIVIPVIIAMTKSVDVDHIVAFAVTSAAVALGAPIQGHLRRLLHLTNLSWTAAAVSVAQLFGAVAALAILRIASVPSPWVPLGALAMANAFSILVGLAAVERAKPDRKVSAEDAAEGLATAMAGINFRHLARSGKWLVMTGLMSTGNNLLVAGLITTIASSDALGFAEAARIVAQPMLVVAFGLRSALGPRSMEAGAARNEREGLRIANITAMLVAGIGLAYLLVAGGDWAWNPLARLVPNAYEVAWLVPLTVFANALVGSSLAPRLELIGGDLEPMLFKAEVVGNASQVGTSAIMAVTAATVATGAFARPAGFAVLGGVRWIYFRRILQNHYSDPLEETIQEGHPLIGGSVT